jgi:hypothetical protein
MYEVKGSDNLGRRSRKGQLNMSTKMTGMTQGIIFALRAGDG